MRETKAQMITQKLKIAYDTINEVVLRHNQAELDIKNIDARLSSLEEEVRQILKRFEKN